MKGTVVSLDPRRRCQDPVIRGRCGADVTCFCGGPTHSPGVSPSYGHLHEDTGGEVLKPRPCRFVGLKLWPSALVKTSDFQNEL